MTSFITKHLNKNISIVTLLGSLFLLPSICQGWTSARLEKVNVVLELAENGEALVTNFAHYEVSAGKFHGFDLAPLENKKLVKEKCYAEKGNGQKFKVKFKRLFDGRIRVVLADKKAVGRSRIHFVIVYKTNLAELGMLRDFGSRTRLDWTPLIWDSGTDEMSLTVVLPQKSRLPILPNEDISKDYVVNIEPDRVSFKKVRTVRWYPMRVVMDFDRSIVLGLDSTDGTENSAAQPSALTTKITPPKSQPSFWITFLPTVCGLLGFIFMMLKSLKLKAVLGDLSIKPQFRLLTRTQIPTRFVLSLLSLMLGLFAQHQGSLAAGIPALLAAVALWMVKREVGESHLRPGGNWRIATDVEITQLNTLAKSYRKRRRLWVDISHPVGLLLFAALLSSLGYGIYMVALIGSPKTAIAMLMNSTFWFVPAFWSHLHAELPVDPVLEGFSAMAKWKKGLFKTVSKAAQGAKVSLWIRKDDSEILETRLKVDSPPGELLGMEVAADIIRKGTSQKVRKAVILRLTPGTPLAREIATCPHAAEHHLTPDLEEEIIVLRNRRGKKDNGLASIRTVLNIVTH